MDMDDSAMLVGRSAGSADGVTLSLDKVTKTRGAQPLLTMSYPVGSLSLWKSASQRRIRYGYWRGAISKRTFTLVERSILRTLSTDALSAFPAIMGAASSI